MMNPAARLSLCFQSSEKMSDCGDSEREQSHCVTLGRTLAVSMDATADLWMYVIVYRVAILYSMMNGLDAG